MIAPEVGVIPPYISYRRTHESPLRAVAVCWSHVSLYYLFLTSRLVESIVGPTFLQQFEPCGLSLLTSHCLSYINDPWYAVEFRPIRCIALAMELPESRRKLLGLRDQGFEPISTEGTPSLWLSRLWPSPVQCSRLLDIPKDARSRRALKLGDVGFWRTSRRGHPFFKVLCNVRDAFPVKIHQMAPDFEEITSTLSSHVYV